MEEAYKFGCGRYIQEADALLRVGEEAKRFGKKALILAGPTAWKVSEEKIVRGMKDAGVNHVLHIYGGYPSKRQIDENAAQFKSEGCDLIIGVGGGRMMDLAKASADACACPVINVPTIAATCAAYAPLSVIYTEEGRDPEYWWFEKEVDAIVVDETIMAHQPARYLASGSLDAIAKFVEVHHNRGAFTPTSVPVDVYAAYHSAATTYELLNLFTEQACADVVEGKLTEAVHTVVFCNIALTGIISSMTRGRGQAALGHSFYNGLKTCFFDETHGYKHGELVGTGLLVQTAFDKNDELRSAVMSLLKKSNLPVTFAELGIVDKEEGVRKLADYMENYDGIKDIPEGKKRLIAALETL